MTAARSIAVKRLWSAAFVLSLVTVCVLGAHGELRCRAAGGGQGASMTYLCLADQAVQLEPDPLRRWGEERGKFLKPSRARARCLWPGLPVLDDDGVELAASSPALGAGLVLQRAFGPRRGALDAVRELLEGRGWSEAAGAGALDRPGVSGRVAIHERDGDWIVTAAIDGVEPGAVALVSVGFFRTAGAGHPRSARGLNDEE